MAGAARRCGVVRVVLHQRAGWQFAKSPYLRKACSHVFFTIFDFRLILFRASRKPKLSDSRELWDTRRASECY